MKQRRLDARGGREQDSRSKGERDRETQRERERQRDKSRRNAREETTARHSGVAATRPGTGFLVLDQLGRGHGHGHARTRQIETVLVDRLRPWQQGKSRKPPTRARETGRVDEIELRSGYGGRRGRVEASGVRCCIGRRDSCAQLARKHEEAGARWGGRAGEEGDGRWGRDDIVAGADDGAA